jgi:hypothetical protein
VANGSNEKGRASAATELRAGDRFALTVISLALDEIDATAVLTGDTELSVRRELSPTSP